MHARSPGRVNLIGEHTDYNGGFVMPCAIALETRVRATQRADTSLMVDARHADARTMGYVYGVVAQLRSASIAVPGMDLQIDGSLPLGAGLSSSASLEVAVALAALAIAAREVDRLDVARLAQRAEIEHAGTRCGIMDQFAVLFARAGHAIFLDTRSLEFELIAVPPEARIVICNTMVGHELAGSEFNTRRRECEQCVRLLQSAYPAITQLRDLTEAELVAARDLLTPELYRRALHVVTENARVLQAREALRKHDLCSFGDLMNASHESLRVLYDVSCEELDTMVELARTLPGVYGARMTGGGFGGCTVNLVEARHAGEFRDAMSALYKEKTGIVPELYDGTPAECAALLHD